MTWAKFEDRFPWHRKVRGLSDAAFRLHVSAVCWSCEHLTDGAIPAGDLPLVSDVKNPLKAVSQLVARGMWEISPDGWSIHDFLVYNEPRAVILARREADAERKRRGRENRATLAVPSGVRPDVQPDSAAESSTESVRTGPVRSVSTNPTRSAELTDAALTLVSNPPPSPDPFDEFWAAWPRKVAKQPAAKAYRKALKTTDPATLLAAAIAYRDDPRRQAKAIEYTLHPATWLNDRRWEDEKPAPTPAWGYREIAVRTDW